MWIKDKLLTFKNGEVEWKKLGEVCEVLKGKQLNKTELLEEGEYPAYNGGVTYSGFTDKYNVEKNTTIISQGGASAGFVQFIEKDFWANAHCYYLKPNIDIVDNKYIYYFFVNNNELIQSYFRGSGVKHPDMRQILELQLPIPPLTIQKEIVRILDAFTELTTELKTELTARKKQYEYYRDKLLTFKNGEVEWKKLGEVGEVRMCKRILKAQTQSEGDIPFYKIGTFGKHPNAYISRALFEEYKEKYNYPKIGDILISASGTIGRTVIFDGEDAYFQDSNIVWIENDESVVLNKFLFYFYKIANWDVADGGTIQRLYNNQLKNLPIPIPPISRQKEIVEVLDKFDALTNSITEGLPREIELRQKQYEYYRNELLNFEL